MSDLDALPTESDFPSFWEGLSLRLQRLSPARGLPRRFPFLFGRAFIEALPGS